MLFIANPVVAETLFLGRAFVELTRLDMLSKTGDALKSSRSNYKHQVKEIQS